jgi:dolichol-phosphate mannosyltransferase
MKALVLIPTYNERDNIAPVVDALLRHQDVSVLVADDRSPDGTGEVADRPARSNPSRVGVWRLIATHGRLR